MTACAFAALAAVAVGTELSGGEEERLSPPGDARPDYMQPLRHHEWVQMWTEQQRDESAENPDVWVGEGIRADRNAQQITFWAEATGLPPDAPVEFLLIDERSGHDYEAIAISYSRPSEVHAALTFLGLPPGEPYMPRQLRFFPKGERVWVTFRWDEENGERVERRAESLIRYLRTGTSLPGKGFTFVGSQWIENNGEQVYAADHRDPRSIISLYSEPTTVLDFPRVAGQQLVYGFLQPYPDRQPAFGTLLEINIQPEFPDGRRRVLDMTLRVDVSESGSGVGAQLVDGDTDSELESGITLQLFGEDGEHLNENVTLVGVLAAFERHVDAGQTPFVRVESSDAVHLVELRDLYRWLSVFFQSEDILYIEPPVGSELFYRAFLPNENHRDPAQRPSQALELRIPSDESQEPVRVVEIQDTRRRIEEEFDPVIIAHDIQRPDQLPGLLADINHHLPVLLVFAPARMSLGELMTWIGPVRETHPMVHIFIDEP